MTDTQLVVRVQNVYGERRIYPACSKSNSFAEIAGTATLTPRVISLIKLLGYSFTTEEDVI